MVYHLLMLSLLWSLVKVHSQSFPRLSSMGQTLANRSYVDISEEGDDGSGSDSVQCITDLNSCCSGNEQDFQSSLIATAVKCVSYMQKLLLPCSYLHDYKPEGAKFSPVRIFWSGSIHLPTSILYTFYCSTTSMRQYERLLDSYGCGSKLIQHNMQ